MSEITREEFNGLGRRVNSLETKHAACSAEKATKIQNLEAVDAEVKESISTLFEVSNKNHSLLAGLPAKIIGGLAAIFVILQLVERFLSRLGL